MPDVSVIIAAYNVAPYIERAVASALAQTGIDVEVVVVDDCSTDNTWTILQGMSDPRVRVHQLPANGGPSVARNRAIELASGRWLAVLDGDDAFLPGRLQNCLAAAPDADVIADNLSIRREADGLTSLMYPPAKLTGELTLARLINNDRMMQGGWAFGYLKPIFRAEFLARHGLRYSPDLRIGEDYCLLAEVLGNGARGVLLPDAGYEYTVRAGSISHRLTAADVERMKRADDELLARITLDNGARRAQRRRRRSQDRALAFTHIVDALKARNVPQAVRLVLSNPAAAMLLWLPVDARLRRLLGFSAR